MAETTEYRPEQSRHQRELSSSPVRACNTSTRECIAHDKRVKACIPTPCTGEAHLTVRPHSNSRRSSRHGGLLNLRRWRIRWPALADLRGTSPRWVTAGQLTADPGPSRNCSWSSRAPASGSSHLPCPPAFHGPISPRSRCTALLIAIRSTQRLFYTLAWRLTCIAL